MQWYGTVTIEGRVAHIQCVDFEGETKIGNPSMIVFLPNTCPEEPTGPEFSDTMICNLLGTLDPKYS